jgi:uncharacterized protein (DUF1684 family)
MFIYRFICGVALFLHIATPSFSQSAIEVDVCVYGGTSAGVIAAYTVAQQGKSVLLIEPGNHLGGLSSGGLGYTDIGNKYAITGLARDFYRRVGDHYGQFEQWTFEPNVAEAIFNDYVTRGDFPVLFERRLKHVIKNGTSITEIILENSKDSNSVTDIRVKAKMFLDCGYEGDLMAQAGVSFTVGRESSSTYNEFWNGVQLRTTHQFPNGIDPYVIPGNPQSGLLWGISNASLQPNGTGDTKVQAYNYRICLTSNAQNRIEITEPEGYDASRYELLLRLMTALNKKSLSDYFIWNSMPNSKTDINHKGGFSTDMIGMNYNYPNGTYAERKQIIREHEIYTKGLLYFLGHNTRVPIEIRTAMLKWGYPKDEYLDNGNWSPQLYVRETRRMIGNYVMTSANCNGGRVVNDGVGMAAYTMDSHNVQRLVVNGQVKNEGCVEVGGFGPYPVSYNSLVPKPAECNNLLVPVCLSASHIAYGSIRMEPVFMVLGQSSAMAAVMAIEKNTSVQNIDIPLLQQRLANDPLADGSLPEVLIDNRDVGQVQITGTWFRETSGGYGPDFLSNPCTSGNVEKVRFTPVIPVEGNYDVYAYFPYRKDVSSRTTLNVYDGWNAPKEIIVNKTDINKSTTGQWFPIGTFCPPKGSNAYVEVTTLNADAKVFADAVVWVPKFNLEPPADTLREPDNPQNITTGLNYQYFHGTWSTLPDFSALSSVKTGSVSTPDLSPRIREDNYAFRFSSFINIPEDGVYTFYITSNDGSQLFIGNTLVVNNDGLHEATEALGSLGLKKGKHAFTLTFFEATGDASLTVHYSGPEIQKQVIPPSSFFRLEDNLRNPENPENIISGLNYSYYHGVWSSLPEYSGLAPIKSGNITNVDLSPRIIQDNYAFKFSGFINVPEDGIYTFYTTSDDGSQLYIGNTLVVNNDGLHGAIEASGNIGLKTGKHALVVTYFERLGNASLVVRYAGPTIQKQIIPPTSFYRKVDDLRAPENPEGCINGLTFYYYHGIWSYLPDFSTITPEKTGTLSNIDLSPRIIQDNYAFKFSGFINVPEDGIYTFYTTSDDGSQLFIGNTLVVNNDGLHGAIEAAGTIGLKQGKHAFTVTYFERQGEASLVVRYAGPDIQKQIIPPSEYYRMGTYYLGIQAIEESPNAIFQVYPNPAYEEIFVNVTTTTNEIIKIKIADIYGQSINNLQVIGSEDGLNTLRMNVSDLPKGLYYLSIQKGNNVRIIRIYIGR